MTKEKESEIKEDIKEEKEEKKTKEVSKKDTKKVKKEKKPVPTVKVDKAKIYPIVEAIKLIKEISTERFDASVEVHFNLGIDPRKGDQQIRSTVSLPHGTGKDVRIVAFVEDDKVEAAKKAGADIVGNDDIIAEIKKTEKTDFQVAIAEPAMMRKLGPIAKILGTRGLMPSPKNETVTIDPIKAISELKKGKISFKNDDTANLHIVIGKKSFTDEQLIENLNTLIRTIIKIKPVGSKGTYIKNTSISTSMGAGVKIDIS